jgi:hypothetical protein
VLLEVAAAGVALRVGALEATARPRYHTRPDLRRFGDAPSPCAAGYGLFEGKRLTRRTTCASPQH